MLKIAVFGANGRMGRAVTRVVTSSADAEIVGACTESGHETVGQDVGELAGLGNLGVVVTANAEEALANADVAIDFTLPAAAPGNLAACRQSGCALVMGTTGLTPEHVALIGDISQEITILYGRNLSVGVNVFTELARQAARFLADDWDVEIVEAHHKFKKDAPSGTAVRISEIVADALGRNLEEVGVYGRKGFTERKAKEIGIHTLRAGDIVGEHRVLFGGMGENLEIFHRAQSRETFARGAVRAALWIVNQPIGMYDMQDVLGLNKT